MSTSTNIDISSIMGKMLVQLSCQEFCVLMRYAAANSTGSGTAATVSEIHQVVGVTLLANKLGCSASFLYTLKSKGVLDGSIISHIGKKVVFDVDRARSLADKFQAEQRANR